MNGAERIAGDTTAEAVSWLEKRAGGRPTFLFFHLFDPHWVYRPPLDHLLPLLREGQSSKYEDHESLHPEGGEQQQVDDYIRFYDAEIAYADAQVGLLIAALKTKAYWEKTLLIVMADHGETLDERGWFFDHGGRVNEEQIRIPLLIRFPGDRYSGRRLDAPVHQIDLLQTVLDFLGIPEPPGLHGRSLVPVVRQEAEIDSSRPLVSMARPTPERMKDLPSLVRKKGAIVSVRSWPHKLIVYPGPEGEDIHQLFNLEDDPGEEVDLSRSNPEAVARLLAELTIWRRKVDGSEELPVPELSQEAEDALRSLGYIR
jgi:arylsulfatase A-like enzyme